MAISHSDRRRRAFMTVAAAFAATLFLTACSLQDRRTPTSRAKYVFYFISDGTGVNTVLGAELYGAARQGRIGRDSLCLTQFPVVGVSSTYSASHRITDSAASGTALATGHKTRNRRIGMDTEADTSYTSIAVWAKQAGRRVGVATSVCINHATPAAFYAHVADRGDYYEVGTWLPVAGFDFYGGSDFYKPAAPDSTHTDLYAACADSGYVIARGYADYLAQRDAASRIILFQQDEEGRDPFSLPYNIDARPGQMNVADVLRAEIDFLMKDSTAGFFLMNEIGAKVDFACHANDGATAFAEVALVDSCIRIAYDFYLRHPDETLIVLTADHETGGLVLANPSGSKDLDLAYLARQRGSQDSFTMKLHELRTAHAGRVTWEQVRAALTEHYGFWDTVPLTADDERTLREVYEASFRGQMPDEQNLYSVNAPLAGAANRIINAKAGLSWATGKHSAGLVPVYACGVGAELFAGHNDNAAIPRLIATVAGYPIPDR